MQKIYFLAKHLHSHVKYEHNLQDTLQWHVNFCIRMSIFCIFIRISSMNTNCKTIYSDTSSIAASENVF